MYQCLVTWVWEDHHPRSTVVRFTTALWLMTVEDMALALDSQAKALDEGSNETDEDTQRD